MSFDDGDKVPLVDAPDFSQDISRYTEQVQTISIQIKSAQSILDDINSQIDVAKKQRQAAYNLQIKDLDQQIIDKTAKIQVMQAQHADWLAKINIRRGQHDNISLNFTEQQKVLDDAWVAFRLNNSGMATQQAQLKRDQNILADQQASLVIDRQRFEDTKAVQQKSLDDQFGVLAAKEQGINNELSALSVKALVVENGSKILDQKQIDIDAKLSAAQLILDQAETITKQKTQNEIDANNNSALALRNQQDYNQIQVAKVALNNQQQQYNSRMATLQAAEAALKQGV